MSYEVRGTVRLVLSTLGGGGAERVAVELCRIWQAQGLPTQILLIQGGGIRATDVPQGVEIHFLGASRARYALPALIRWEARNGRLPTLVFGFEAGALLTLGRTLGLLGSPVIYREGTSPEVHLALFKRMIYQLVLRRVDAVVVQSSSMIPRLLRLGLRTTRVTAIANPVEDPGARAKHRRIRSGDSITMLAVGRLAPEKGFDMLIEGFAAVVANRPGSRLIILGEGAQRSALENIARYYGVAGSVQMPGYRPLTIDDWLLADVFVLSSKYEGLPNALMQAIAAGLRILATPASPATIDLLHKCGLTNSLIPKVTGNELVRRLNDCFLVPDRVWLDASERLLAKAEATAVAREYREFCTMTA